MINGIVTSKGVGATDKAKAKPKAGGVGGASFAQMLDEATAAQGTGGTPAAMGVALGGAFVPVEEAPRDGKGQAQALMDALKDLAEDVFAGEPSGAVARLEALAADVDESQLNATQKQALAEVRTRAAVEVAKLKH